MGPEELPLHYTKHDTTLIDSADLREWISAIASAAVLNKPRLATNANKSAKLLVSETGLGAETGNDLATLALEDLASFMSRADAYAIYNMLDGRALPDGDDCDVSGKTSATGTSASLEGAQSQAQSMEHALYLESLKDISKSTRDGMRSSVKASRKKPLSEVKFTRPPVGTLIRLGQDVFKKRGQSGDTLAMAIREIYSAPSQHNLDEVRAIAAVLDNPEEARDLAEDITAVVRTEVIESLPEATDSGLVLYKMMMQQAIERPFVLLKNDLRDATEAVVSIAKDGDLLQEFEAWYSSVLEVRYTEYVSLETLMESLCILLERFQPLLKQCDRLYAAAGDEQQQQTAALDKILKHIRIKGEEMLQIRKKEPSQKKSAPRKLKGGKGSKGGSTAAKGGWTRF